MEKTLFTSGYFAIEYREKSKSPIFINKPLSIYNILRP